MIRTPGGRGSVVENFLMSSFLAQQSRLLELVALLPARLFRLGSSGPSQGETETCDGGIATEIHTRAVFIAGLVVMLVGKFLGLFDSPLRVMAFVLHSFVDGKRGHANPRHTEVVRTVVMTGLGMRIGPDSKPKLLGHGFNRRIKSGALRS